MDCGKCSQAINKGEIFTVCEGKCSKRFHAACVGVDEEQWNALSNNVIWLCDPCMDDFCKYRDDCMAKQDTKAVRSIDEEVAELKTQMTTVMETLAALTASKSSLPGRSIDRHSTPVSSSYLHSGMNSEYEHSYADLSNDQHLQADDPFELFLTNIHRRVTEDEISSMVSRCLRMDSTDSFDVKKLVSKGKDCSRLDYISFKIVLSDNHRTLALNESTWPKGVKFREFVNRHNDTWKP